ncbi:MAG: pectate lyase [Pedobacter sp.]|nr:MAG: pectate lyase [Pedobacter sp.]
MINFNNIHQLQSSKLKLLLGLIFVLISFVSFAQTKKIDPPKPIYKGKDGRLAYTPDALGNRIPDFSYSGYMAGESAIPSAFVKVVVPVKDGDATLRIQSAINYVSKLPLSKDGLRGAVLLEKGTYKVAGTIKITASGVVLRGSGMSNEGTIIQASGLDRIGVIRILGKADKIEETPVAIADDYVPVNALKFSVTNATNFKVGDNIFIHRPSTKEWIETLKTAEFGGGESALGWKPGTRDIHWDRKIISIAGNTITIDAPITTALDAKYGGGTVSKYKWDGRISQSGVENLKLQSDYHKENLKDEYHRWNAISLENVEDVWVRQVVFERFAGSAVNVLETAKRITVEDCKSLAPVSEIGGERRNTFFTSGQQVLFQRIYAEYGMHDFAVGFCAPGPNAFVQCQSYLPFSFSGAIDSWASGTLFDIVNVDGQALSFMNRGQDGQGAGWAAANSVFWQSTAARVDNYQPPTAQNWAFGTWAQFAGDGYWDMSNEQIQPRSLYYAQLKDRIGNEAESRNIVLPVETEASSSPPVDVAQKLTKIAYQPALTLIEFIDKAGERNKISTDKNQAKNIDLIGVEKLAQPTLAGVMSIKNGWLVRGKELVVGNRQDVQWWNGSARPYGLKNSKAHITRFVPGRAGKGLTDDLDDITDSMKEGTVKILDHNYGLWYDRRRDDHERIRRMDGDVWAPFYELPFARSGQDKAWDGLSKYDISKYNLWYWDRLKTFANLADQKGLVLIHENYFQHNIIEAGAHYADFPWRTANNINSTGFPEPVPYAGDKRIFMAEQFYDINDPVRRKLHKAYIYKCLENFNDNNGVIQLIGAEFTGPLHFVQFWLDTIKEWEKATGKHPIIGLSVTKDVQDAILADANRAGVVDLIDIRYWHYQEDGTTYAPQGGQNLAPRQHARLLKPKKTSFEQVYRAVAEYKAKFPNKAVIYSGDNFTSYGWAILMAGGSLSNVSGVDDSFLTTAATMKPFLPNGAKSNQYGLENLGKAYILYNASADAINLDLSKFTGSFKMNIQNTRNGSILKEEKINAGSIIKINKVGSGDEVIILNKI